jgi:hypothetical protein
MKNKVLLPHAYVTLVDKARWCYCSQTFKLLAFQSLDFVRTWWRLFQKRIVRTKLDIYVLFYYKTLHRNLQIEQHEHH